MHVEMRPLAGIKPYENNPRHNDVDAVAASIKQFGFRQPIVVDEQDVIIVGHTRYKGTLKLGLEEVSVHVARGLTPAQARYRMRTTRQLPSLPGTRINCRWSWWRCKAWTSISIFSASRPKS